MNYILVGVENELFIVDNIIGFVSKWYFRKLLKIFENIVYNL